MPYVGIVFEIRKAETVPGEAVRVVGAGQELGAWDPLAGVGSGMPSAEADVLLLKTGVLTYPQWTMSSPVWIRFGHDAEEDDEFDLSTVDSCGDATPLGDSDFASSEESTPAMKRQKVEQAEPDSGTRTCTRTLEVEYKFLKDLRQLAGDSDGRFKWEESIENRRAAVPGEPGSMWLVSDALWGEAGRPSVTRIAHADVVSRCVELDPDHTLGRGKVKIASQQFDGVQVKIPSPLRCAFSLSPCSTPRDSEKTSFAIEDEFEALAKKSFPDLLAEKLAAEKTANELATELMSLRRDTAMASEAKRQAEEEAKASRDQVAQLKEAMMEVAHRLEATSKEHTVEVKGLIQENAALREENVRLCSSVDEVRWELQSLREALASVDESCKAHAAEAKRLSEENAQLQQQNVSLQSQLTPLPQDDPELSTPPVTPIHSLRERVGSVSSDSKEPCPESPHFWRNRAGSEGLVVPEDATARHARIQKMLLQARSSLSSTQKVEKSKEAEKEEQETELMRALRRRREKLAYT